MCCLTEVKTYVEDTIASSADAGEIRYPMQNKEIRPICYLLCGAVYHEREAMRHKETHCKSLLRGRNRSGVHRPRE